MANPLVDWSDNSSVKPGTNPRRWTREDTLSLFFVPMILGTLMFILICVAGDTGGVIITSDRELIKRLSPIVEEWRCERSGSGFVIQIGDADSEEEQTSP